MKKDLEIIFFINLFLLTILFNVWAFKLLKKNLELGKEINILKGDFENLFKKNEKLKKERERQSLESFWEELIRERGFKKEGEETVIIKKIFQK